MKTSVVKFFAGSGIRLAVLSLLFLAMAGVCMAQASAVANPAAPAAAGRLAAAVPQAQISAQPAQTGAPAAKGTHEGIKVHGHWTIEVKNPDGKLVTHREFENSLAPNNGRCYWQASSWGQSPKEIGM
jgi:Na+-transporting methylmalonyl-CoA/oxaloacetate decarboxylase gamma subunit